MSLRAKQPLWTPEKTDHWDEPDKHRRVAKAVTSFVSGTRFKTEADFIRDAAEQDAEEKVLALASSPGSIVPESDAVDDLTPTYA